MLFCINPIPLLPIVKLQQPMVKKKHLNQMIVISLPLQYILYPYDYQYSQT